MTAVSERGLRIGEVAELTGTTPRTIRYYEEIGLLPGAADRAQGQHRCYTQSDIDRVAEIVRLRDLLDLSLEQVGQLAALDRPARIDRLLELVRERRRELGKLESELVRRKDR